MTEPSNFDLEAIDAKAWAADEVTGLPAEPVSIGVTTFVTLAKLAERYGRLVLHWTRSDSEIFIVQDENTIYRSQTGRPP
ncbi:hypothetical protein, partial [Arthrobacter sp. H14]|uniref:hypothetical protein n=1 Tax=Arthrobacter sp. H14 TaxID=1312959 RepID=UPI00056857F5